MTITLGAESDIGAIILGSPRAIVYWLTDTEGVLFDRYDDGGNDILAVYELSRSGDTITIGSPVDVDTFTDFDVQADAVPLGSTHLLVAYREDTGSDEPIYGRVYSLASGTFGTRVELVSDANNDRLDPIRLSALNGGAKAVLSYTDPANSNFGTVVAFTISGTTIGTPGTPVVWRSASTFMARNLPTVGETDAVVIMYGTDAGAAITAYALTLSGTTISVGSPLTVNSETCTNPTIVPLDVSSGRYAVTFRNTTFNPKIARVQAIIRSGTAVSLENSTGGMHGTFTANLPYADAVVVLDNSVLIALFTGDDNEPWLAEMSYDTGSGWTLESNLQITIAAGYSQAGLAWSQYQSNATTLHFDDADPDIVTLTSSIAPAPSTENSFRFLGMDSDDNFLYVTGLKDNANLELFRYDLSSLAESGTITFGAATNAEIDAGSRNLKPVVKPGSNGFVYLYGRDGGNVHVQSNATFGTGAWTNLDEGTATWATTKVAIALLPHTLFTDDLVVVFSDLDIYRSVLVEPDWIATNTSLSGTALTALRHPTKRGSLAIGLAAAGSVLYSNNYGASVLPGGDTAIGTINHMIAVRNG